MVFLSLLLEVCLRLVTPDAPIILVQITLWCFFTYNIKNQDALKNPSYDVLFWNQNLSTCVNVYGIFFVDMFYSINEINVPVTHFFKIRKHVSTLVIN